jgi:hypothetical protein
LSSEKDSRLTPSANRVRVCCGEFRKKRIELTRRHSGIPRLKRELKRWYKLFKVPAGSSGNVDAGSPRNVCEILVDFPFEIATSIVF